MGYHYRMGPLSERDFLTLDWLSANGYDGGVFDLAAVEPTSEGVYLSLAESDAWEVASHVEDDPDAFLACCGSDTLADAMRKLVESIV